MKDPKGNAELVKDKHIGTGMRVTTWDNMVAA